MFSNIKQFCLPILAVALTACGGSDSGNNSREQTAVGVIKMLPVSAHAPGLSVLVDGGDDVEGDQLGDLAFGQIAIFGLPSGNAAFTVRYSLPDGAGPGRRYESALSSFQISVVENVRYDLFIGGDYPNAEHWVAETPRTYDERETHARLVMTNASPSMAEVDVYLTAVGASVDSASLLTSLAYKETDNSIRVTPGDYQLKVTAAGSSTVVYTGEKLTLAAGTDISLVTMDNAWVKQGITGKSPIVVSSSGTSGSSRLIFSADSGADLRAVHASPDAGVLDIVLDENFTTPFAENISLGGVTPYSTLEAGVFNFQVVPADGSNAQIDTNFNLVNGVAWTMFVMNEWDNLEPMFISENAREIAAYSRLRVVHGSTVAEELDLYITEAGTNIFGGPPTASGVSFKQFSNFLGVEPDSYDITFVPAGTLFSDPVYQLQGVNLVGNEVYTLLLRDEAGATGVTHNWLDSAP